MSFKSFVSEFRVQFKMTDLNGLLQIAHLFPFIGFDRDGTTGGFHAPKPDPKILAVLKELAPKGEMISNSSFRTLKEQIRPAYCDLMPCSIMAGFGPHKAPHLIRFERGGKLQVFRYYNGGVVSNCTAELATGDVLLEKPTCMYKKPNPLVLKAVKALAIRENRIPVEGANLLYVGDKFWTDVMCANRAGFLSARVKTIGQLSDLLCRPDYFFARVGFDLPVGSFFSWLADRQAVGAEQGE